MGPITFLAALSLSPARAQAPVVLAEAEPRPTEVDAAEVDAPAEHVTTGDPVAVEILTEAAPQPVAPEAPAVDATPQAPVVAAEAPVQVLLAAEPVPVLAAPVLPTIAAPVVEASPTILVEADPRPLAIPPETPSPGVVPVIADPQVLAEAPPKVHHRPPAEAPPRPPPPVVLVQAPEPAPAPIVQRSHPLERSLDGDFLGHLPEENYGAPLWRLLGPADAQTGAIGPTLHWNGLPIAGPGDPLPELPVGSVQGMRAIAAVSGGDLWAPGGRAMEIDLGLAEGGAVQLTATSDNGAVRLTQLDEPNPSLRGVGRAMGRVDDNVVAGAAVDLEPYRTSALTTAVVSQDNTDLELLASGTITEGGTDVLLGSSFSERDFGSSISAVGRMHTTPDGQRLYRVGVGARLHRDPKTGLSAGIEVDHWAVDARLVRRAGIYVEESQQGKYLDIVAAARIDTQDRTGGTIEDRMDVAPRAHARLHTAARYPTGISVGFARSGGSYTPVGADIPETDQLVFGLDQALPAEMSFQAKGTVTQIEDGEAVSVDFGLDRRAGDLSFLAHVAAGAWSEVPEGSANLPWAAATLVASWNVELLVPTRLGIAARWRNSGEDLHPAGAIGWLGAQPAPHADLGGRAIVALPVGETDQALELEVSGWARAEQIPVIPQGEGFQDVLYPTNGGRMEAAVRYAW